MHVEIPSTREHRTIEDSENISYMRGLHKSCGDESCINVARVLLFIIKVAFYYFVVTKDFRKQNSRIRQVIEMKILQCLRHGVVGLSEWFASVLEPL